jgi:hypothetical protein
MKGNKVCREHALEDAIRPFVEASKRYEESGGDFAKAFHSVSVADIRRAAAIDLPKSDKERPPSRARKLTWQIEDERTSPHGAVVQLLRSGKHWGVRIWWDECEFEITKHASEQIAREQFATANN